jgi:hypothetical protein
MACYISGLRHARPLMLRPPLHSDVLARGDYSWLRPGSFHKNGALEDHHRISPHTNLFFWCVSYVTDPKLLEKLGVAGKNKIASPIQ